MKPFFHCRGPFVARAWVLLALIFLTAQLGYVIEWLSNRDSSFSDSETAHDYGKSVLQAPEDSNDRYNEIPVHKGKSASDTANAPIKEPPLSVGPASEAVTERPNQFFSVLQQSVMEEFSRGLNGLETTSDDKDPPSKARSLLPMLQMLPMLLETPSKSGLNLEKYLPLLERMEKFGRQCARTFKKTIVEAQQKYPARTKDPNFTSAVAMKGFFWIFADEDWQEEFLEICDQAADLLEALGLTDHIIDVMSGRAYDKLLKGNGMGGTPNLNLMSMLLPGPKAVETTAKPKDSESKSGDDDYVDEEESSLVSNEHFESIMEIYDSIFRDEEVKNETLVKLELRGRTFLQTWYEAMRRYGREKGKIRDRKFNAGEFDKYIESIEIPFTNILDFYYPIKNEQACRDNSTRLAIILLSRTQNLEYRRFIRETWASQVPPSVKVFFVLSDRDEDREKIKPEAERYGDVITVDVSQVYELAARKTLVTMDWPLKYCPSVTNIFKTTDQIFLNILNLLEETGPALVGSVVKDEPVQRIPLKLRYLFYDEYPYDKYPPYIGSFGYLMDINFAKKALAAAKDFPLMRNEGFTITGVLASKVKLAAQAFVRHGVVNLSDAPWDDAAKLTELLCKNKGSVGFEGIARAEDFNVIQQALRKC